MSVRLNLLLVLDYMYYAVNMSKYSTYTDKVVPAETLHVFLKTA